MAVSMLDNISYKGNKPDNIRSQFETVSDMASFSENYLPDIYTTLVVENGKRYKFLKSNSVDPVLGKWREDDSASVDLTEYYNKTEINGLLADKIIDDDFNPIKETVQNLVADKDTVGSVRNLDSQIYQESKTYTDERVESLNKKKSIACDEAPVYNRGETIADDTITYLIDGEEYTIPADEIWFYYMAENDLNSDGMIGANEIGLAQTIFINRIPFTIMSFGIDMTEYVNKNQDVVSDYTGEEQDTSKIPDIAALHKLEERVKSTIDVEVSADEVKYTNENYPAQTNVQKALDAIWNKIDYVKPSISSFTMTPSTTDYEVGQEVTSLAFAWNYNKAVTKQTLTDCTLADENTRNANWSGSIKTSKTFTLSCSDGQNSASTSKTISFKNKVYYGSAALPEEFISSFILGLSNKQFATGYKGTYKITVASGQYGFVCCPASWNMPNSCKIGGFGTDLVNCGTISFTNASGGVVSYKIVRTNVSGLGAIEMLFE